MRWVTLSASFFVAVVVLSEMTDPARTMVIAIGDTGCINDEPGVQEDPWLIETCNLRVGDFGSGTLHLSWGGRVFSRGGQIGAITGSTGIATVPARVLSGTTRKT